MRNLFKFRATLIITFLFTYLFINITSGVETHLCVHKSGHTSFESIDDNGDCVSLTEEKTHHKNKKTHVKKYKTDPCEDFELAKVFFNSRKLVLALKDQVIKDIGVLIKYDLSKEAGDKLSYLSTPIEEQKNFLVIKSSFIRTVVLLN